MLLFCHCMLLLPLDVGVLCWVVDVEWFFMSFLVNQPVRGGRERGRESMFLRFNFVMNVFILCLLYAEPEVGLCSVIVEFPGHIYLFIILNNFPPFLYEWFSGKK